MNEKKSSKIVAPRRRFSPWWWLAGMVAFLVGVPILAHFYSTSEAFAPPLVISKETTYITEPLTPEGLPDYVAYLNRRLSQGVTPENNAVVLLLQALGPKLEGRTLPAWVFRRLGMRPPKKQGKYFVPVDKGLNRHFQGQPQKLYVWSQLQSQLSTRPWHHREAPGLVKLLEQNRGPLEIVRQASLRPRFYMPPLVDPQESLLSTVLVLQQSLRTVAHALLLRAMLHLGHGRVEEAWQDILTLQRLGRLMSQDAFLISTLIGCAIYAMATRGAEQLLIHAELDEHTAMRFLRQWRQLPPTVNVAETVQWSERITALDMMILVVKRTRSADRKALRQTVGGWVPLRGVDVNHLLRRLNQYYDQCVQLLQNQSYSQAEAQFDTWELQLRQAATDPLLIALALVNRTARSELVANVVAELLIGAIMASKAAELRTHQDHRLIETGLALAAYRARHGHYPEKLDALVPQLLPQVPPDLFAPGKTVIYRREGEGYVLYSVGQNGVDDGGLPQSLKNMDDLGFFIQPRSKRRLPLVAPPVENQP